MKTLLLQAPVFSLSGYGKHSMDILKSLYDIDKYNVQILPTRWGSTPLNQTDGETEFGRWVLSKVITKLEQQPDIHIQISVPNEANPIGKWNCLITAGSECSIIPKSFIDGCNKMDLIIVPSEFTKGVMKTVEYREQRREDDTVVGRHSITSPIEVLHEGVNIDRIETAMKLSLLDDIETDFNFLICGTWLKGELGHDRKDIGMTIKTINNAFNSLSKNKKIGIILKVSQGGFSVIDREAIVDKIYDSIGQNSDRIPIYFIHGDLTDNEMMGLYTHPKVKAMVSFTKGEGYGRPLAEFALTGKPIIVSKWSGQLDFLPKENTVFLEGELQNVHKSATDDFLLAEGKWFYVNYTLAIKKLLDVYNNYNKHKTQSKKLPEYIKAKFSMQKMTEKLEKILDENIQGIPEIKEFQLPKL